MNLTEDIQPPLFSIISYGTDLINNKICSEPGILFCCQLSGELSIKTRRADRNLSCGRFYVKDLETDRMIISYESQKSHTAYFTASGPLCRELCMIYGITDGFSVYSPECAGSIFEICRKLSCGATAENCIFDFHKMLVLADSARHRFEETERGTISLIKEYIDTHAEGRLRTEELSEIFFISKAQLFRMFKKQYGTTPTQYLLGKKIELSKQMLESGGKRISDIADALAFSDAKHFSKTFKKFTGELPSNYRRLKKSGNTCRDAENPDKK